MASNLPLNRRPAEPARRRFVRGGIIALAAAWLAWLYWFSRAALLVSVTLAAGLLIWLSVRWAYRTLSGGRDLFRHLGLRVLLTLARRLV